MEIIGYQPSSATVFCNRAAAEDDYTSRICCPAAFLAGFSVGRQALHFTNCHRPRVSHDCSLS
jgi:hypothetical protein